MRPVATISRGILRRFDPETTELSRSVNQALSTLLYVLDNTSLDAATRALEAPAVLDYLRQRLSNAVSPEDFKIGLLPAAKEAPVAPGQLSGILDEVPTLSASQIARLYFLTFLAARE